MQRLNTINDVGLTDSDSMKYRSISLRTIAADPDGANKIIGTLKWMEEQIERAA